MAKHAAAASIGERELPPSQDRIPIRNANALARIGRIMLDTIPGIKTEFPFSYKFEDWNKMLDAPKGLLPAPATPPSPLLAAAYHPHPPPATPPFPSPTQPLHPL